MLYGLGGRVWGQGHPPPSAPALPSVDSRYAHRGLVSWQGAYSAFVYSYAVEKPLSVGHKVAGYLPSLFWGFITLGRLISIPVSSRMRPATMVFINLVSGRVASVPSQYPECSWPLEPGALQASTTGAGHVLGTRCC